MSAIRDQVSGLGTLAGMRRLSDQGLRWRSLILLSAVFLPLAALIGWVLPGYWWWLGAAAYFAAFVFAMHGMAKRDRRISQPE